MIDLAEKAFPCKRIEGHKQEDVNTEYDIANMDEANQRGVQELDSKGLIDTVEEIKNGCLDHCKKTCRHSYNESISVSQEKLELNKTLNPNVAAAADYMSVGACITP